MRKLLNTIIDIWVLISVFCLAIALDRWYKRLARNRKRIFWTLFLLYLTILVLGSL